MMPQLGHERKIYQQWENTQAVISFLGENLINKKILGGFPLFCSTAPCSLDPPPLYTATSPAVLLLLVQYSVKATCSTSTHFLGVPCKSKPQPRLPSFAIMGSEEIRISFNKLCER